MGQTERFADGRFPCVTEGCDQPARAKTKPGKCARCISRDHYHRKHPEAPHLGSGYHGKWKGVQCSVEGCEDAAKTAGLCTRHYNSSRWAGGHGRRSSEKNREAHLKHRYGISLEEYNRLLVEQNGLCAVCGQPPSSENTRAHWGGKLCVDHCHDSSRVRALLCNDCNLAVGYAKTEAVALAVAEYIRTNTRRD